MTKTPKADKIKPVQGLVLHCGYVESSCVGVLFMRSYEGGFNTVKEAVANLAHYLAENYLEHGDAGIDGFSGYGGYLSTLSATVANEWDPAHVNGERWWPWDSLSTLYESLPFFWESVESLEQYLPLLLNPNKFNTNKLFKKELTELQTRDLSLGGAGEIHNEHRQRLRDLSHFKCVAPVKKTP